METAFNQFWDLVSGAFTLNPDVFQQINTLPEGPIIALIIVLMAGLSQAIGQCIVLFVNKVKPLLESIGALPLLPLLQNRA